MGLEVALLEWTDHERGVRLVAQTSDPTLVATVQRYFAADLQGETPEPSKELRLVKGSPDVDAISKTESKNGEQDDA